MANGFHCSTPITESSPLRLLLPIQSGPPLRKRMREVDSGFEFLYDIELMAVMDEIRGPRGGQATEVAMHREGIASDSMCYTHRLRYFLGRQYNRLKRVRPTLPSLPHGHAVLWSSRDTWPRFPSLRRCWKLRHRSRKPPDDMGSRSGQAFRSRQGQRIRQPRGNHCGRADTVVLFAQTSFTLESGNDIGDSSPERRKPCYESPQPSFQLELVKVQQQTSQFMKLALDPILVSNRRVQVWSLIEAKIQHFQKPFIIMGDLNQVRGWPEKLSSHRRIIPGASLFNDLIFRNRLVDLPTQWVWYTWCNNRKESEVVYERLDRVLASSSWVTAFTYFSLVALPIQRSDHSPLLVDTC
ncbi:hypothetical protein LOK49_LG13G01472 [Camellia lanceoleosa]|uniref:Uncharacterized protein n=1 Tax=Camellia lanceoleosa TaxID=1840588 RepID=A0ACC0FI24_9ERIC|nr:hypothetical protein LOK49_LG13G01472 [Camellia lanceoleosa]